MNYAAIKKFDIANGPGVRVSLFVSGCRHKCKNCFNAVAWDFGYGDEFTADTAAELIEATAPDYIEGFSLLGGEPFEPENQAALAEFLGEFKKKLPNKSVWCYTGFTLEQLLSGSVGDIESVKKMLEGIDVLVDGKFVEELKSASLLFRGSSNQNIIDVAASLKAGKTVLLPGVWERKMGSTNIEEG